MLKVQKKFQFYAVYFKVLATTRPHPLLGHALSICFVVCYVVLDEDGGISCQCDKFKDIVTSSNNDPTYKPDILISGTSM